MPDANVSNSDQIPVVMPIDNEGGLRAPAHLGFWGKAWWWFHFLILVKLARLRFIGILLAIGFVIIKWDTFVSYYEKWTRASGQDEAASGEHEYFCPMHPTIIRDTGKEKCPICFMPLSRRKRKLGTEEVLPAGIVNRVQLSPYRVLLAGIQTWEVKYLALHKEITTVGYVEFNEREMKHVAARVKGRIDKLFVNETGQMVEAGEELAWLYSPDLVVTMQNLVDAKRTGNNELLKSAQERLVLWGISDKQIKEILETGKANTHLNIHTPITGHVLKKYVKEGQYVDEGSPLYDIVDLKTVWIQAQVYEEDMAFLPDDPSFHGEAKKVKGGTEKPGKGISGMPVTATTRVFPSRKFPGKLTFVFPHLDQDTRTVIARFELPNPGHQLRPGTSATVKFQVAPLQVKILDRHLNQEWRDQTALEVVAQTLFVPGQAVSAPVLAALLQSGIRQVLLRDGLVLAVPDSAVIDTGNMRIVYREIASGEYEGVRVELGPRMAGPGGITFYPVLKGLAYGDRVVTAGSFLVDAETRLNPAAGSIYFGGSSGSKSGSSKVRPSTPTDEDAKVEAALAKLPRQADRQLARAQKFCPIMKDSRLGLMGVPFKIMIRGQPVFLCCKFCEEPALKKADATLAKAKTLRKAHGKGN